ncbi:MAG: HAMP domain-containing histidine kinase [Spirochaetia bacterium]|nr:HAMP domain-containing histidine kinase [Spirochaetia bacterium]
MPHVEPKRFKTIHKWVDLFLKDIEYRFPITLAVIFVSVIVMTIWWQVLFERMLNVYTDAQFERLELEFHKSQTNLPLLETLIAKKKAVKISNCALEPCVKISHNDESFFLQIHPQYFQAIYEVRNRKWRMIIWETSFLIFVLFLALSYLFWAIYNEKMKWKERQSFLALAAHELKRPLSGISLLLESLKRKTVPENSKEEFINRGLLEIISLKNQLENILKIEELQSSYKKEAAEINLTEFLNNFYLSWIQTDLKNKGRLKFENDLETEVFVKSQSQSLSTILKNLVENALLYSQDDVYLRLLKKSNQIKIEIEDSGIGFDADDIKNLGKMFYRSSKYKVQNIKGSGLGLFIVYKLASQLNLKISLESNIDQKGSVFTIAWQ